MMPVVTVASGGVPVVDVSAVVVGGVPASGLPVSEASNGFGVAVTKVTADKPGLPVIYKPPPP